MLSDKKIPAGLKITHFIVVNVLWYLTFAFIYWNPNPLEWWLFTNPWGRVILVLMELSIIGNAFLTKRNRKI